jgi:hypothetical protein
MQQGCGVWLQQRGLISDSALAIEETLLVLLMLVLLVLLLVVVLVLVVLLLPSILQQW